jgi:xanthine dehydrogenase YagS FAD-binding subunit
MLSHPKHFHAKSISEALILLDKWKRAAKVVAGGTDLIGMLKSGLMSPAVLVNIKNIAGLARIEERDSVLKLGPLATIHDIETSPMIKNQYRLLTESASSVGSPQIRNMGTVAGNLCQQVRCWYYRRPSTTGKTYACYRKGEKTCPAADGNNRDHAIIGARKCLAVCPSDLACALTALDATATIEKVGAKRRVPIERLYTSLGNVLEADEMITEIEVPSPVPGCTQRFLKFRRRKAIDFSVSSVAIMLDFQEGTVNEARIVLGGVAPIPYRATAAEHSLKGATITAKTAHEAAKAALVEAKPLRMNSYKVALTEALVTRTILSR